MSEPLIPVMSSATLKAWPKNEKGGRARYLPLSTALLATFETDAHTAAYSVPAMERRIDYGALRDPAALSKIGGVVSMVLAIFDVDAAESHKALGGSGDIPASDEWWLDELPKVEALLAAHPGLFVYRTRGGYRVVGVLPQPVELRSEADTARWTAGYLEWCCYNRREFSIVADPGCKEFNRLFRLPKATRDGSGKPERRETLGNASAIGTWAPTITAADRDAAVLLGMRKEGKRKKREAVAGGYMGPGILHHVLHARGWLSSEIEPGKWSCRCPREDEHSRGATFDTSTIVVAPGDGETFGLLHCSHSNSGHDRYTLRDWIACFEQSEINAAREALGIPKWEPPAKKSDERPDIELGPNLTSVVDEAIKALAGRDVFQRGGQLVDVVRSAEIDVDGIVKPEGTARVRAPIPVPRLREELGQAARFLAWSKKAGELVEVSPPPDVVSMLSARGQWEHVRPLEGIVQWPVLRPDGTVLSARGYDPVTQLICEYDGALEITANPTLDDAKAALTLILEVVQDFPFADDASRSAWLAGLLTIPARPAIRGPVPMFMVNKNIRGAGGTLLIDVIGEIDLGRSLPRRAAPDEAAEWRKMMLGVALGAYPAILLDNVTRMLRSDVLDMILTGEEYQERLLSKNEEISLKVRTVWYETGNNATASADLVRRALECRLEATTERPEQRSEFKHPDLIAYCRENRAQLLGAVLTVLVAYQRAGRPRVELRPMGSYEQWSAVVRAALVWAGMPDPAVTQDSLRETADLEHEQVGALLPAWFAVHGEKAVTVRAVLADLDLSAEEIKAGSKLSPEQAALRDAIGVLCDSEPGKLPNGRKLGNRLRALRGVIKGEFIFERPKEDHGADGFAWRVRRRAAVSAESPESCSQPSRARIQVESERNTKGLEQGTDSADSEIQGGEVVHIGPPAHESALPEPPAWSFTA